MKPWQERLSELPLFSSLTDSQWKSMEEKADIISFRNGQSISDHLKENPSLAILLQGSATVQNQEGDPACLQILKEHAVFGVANLFSKDNRTVSNIVAQKETVLCCFSAPTIEEWMRSNPAFAMDYIRFLSDRIRFLNQRLTAFTASDTTDRVKYYFSGLCCNSSLPLTVSVNAVRLANMLNMGRASLYRAFDALESAGMLRKVGKYVTILKM